MHLKRPAIRQDRRAFFAYRSSKIGGPCPWRAGRCAAFRCTKPDRRLARRAAACLVRTRQFHLPGPCSQTPPLPRRMIRGISLRENGQAAGPPRCGGPCSHPANFICQGPAHKRQSLAAKSIAAIACATGQAAGPPRCGVPCSHPANFICRGPCSQTPDRIVCSKAPLGPLPPATAAKLRSTPGKAIFDAEPGKFARIALRRCLLAGIRRHFVNETAGRLRGRRLASLRRRFTS